jgi:hypothetical protein
MIPNTRHIVDYRLFCVWDCKPFNEFPSARPRAHANIAEAFSAQFGRLQTARKQATNHFIREEQHSTISVVNNEELARTEELVADDK